MGGFPVRPVGGPLTVLRAEKRLRETRPAAKLSTRRRRLGFICAFAFFDAGGALLAELRLQICTVRGANSAIGAETIFKRLGQLSLLSEVVPM